MNIETLDPNAIGNLGLVNCQKIQLRQHSVIFHHLFKNAVSQSSYTSFFPDKKMYMYTDVVTGREIVGGHSVIFHHLFKNAVSWSSYTSFFPKKCLYTYTDVVTRRDIVGGLTLLKLMYAVIKPQLAVDYRKTEMRTEALTLADCDNNVRTFLTKKQENVLEIDHLRGDGVTYELQEDSRSESS